MIHSDQSTHTVRGYCALCTAHCASVATVTDGKVVRLDADPDHPNGGVFCLKGKAAPELVYHPDRLNYPLKRTRPKDEADPGWFCRQSGSLRRWEIPLRQLPNCARASGGQPDLTGERRRLCL